LGILLFGEDLDGRPNGLALGGRPADLLAPPPLDLRDIDVFCGDIKINLKYYSYYN